MHSSHRVVRLAGVSSAALVILGGAQAAGQATALPTYKLTTLETNDQTAAAYGINSVGQVVGSVQVGENRHSHLWFNGDTNDLHNVVHFIMQHPYFGIGKHEAFAISNGGQIVGTAQLKVDCQPDDIDVTTAFILMPGVLTDLATPYAGDALINLRTLGGNLCVAHDSAATAISNANHVVGWADKNAPAGDTHAFVVAPQGGNWFVDILPLPPADPSPDGINDNMTDLGTLDVFSSVSAATGVNDYGVVVGYSYTATNTLNGQAGYHAFRIVPQGGVWFIDAGDGPCSPCLSNGRESDCGSCGSNSLMDDLGTLGGLNSWARGINNAGVIVGESDTADRHVRAFKWVNGVMTDLGTLGGDNSSASRINDNGDIVGWAEDSSGTRKAVVWINGQIRNLNSSLLATDGGATQLQEARDINDHGQICGWGRTTLGSDTILAPFTLRIASQAEIDEANAIVAGDQVTSDSDSNAGSNTGGGTGGTGNGTGVVVEGTPQNPGDATSDSGSGDTSGGGDVSSATGGLCGAGLANFAPLMLAGLVAMRLRARR